MKRILAITTLFLLLVMILGCATRPDRIEYSDGVKEKIAQAGPNAIAIIFDPDNQKEGFILADKDGRVAKTCKTPRIRKKGEEYKLDPSECIGVSKKHIVTDAYNLNVIRTQANPHTTCLYCYDRFLSSGVWEEICKPTGCDHQ